jgi:PAS domain S-box-containing protein
MIREGRQMTVSGKTEKELIKEISALRTQLEELEQSELKYRSLIANIPDVVWTSDEKGNTTFISKNVKDIYGYSPQEIYTRGDSLWFGRIHPDDIEKVKTSYKAVFEVNKQLDIEYRVRRKDGRWIWIRDRSIGAYEKDGVKYADGVFSDITERKETREELRKSKAFLDNVINTLDDPFFVKDQEHRWFMLNNAACKVMGRPREELIGKSDYDLFPKEQADVFWEKDNLVLETGKTDINEEKITWHGNVHTISTKKSLYIDPVTSKRFITGTIRDMTELKQSEKTLRESEGKLEAMLGSLAEHMSMMDKDLNIIWANETAMNIFGDDIVGRKCYEAYHQRNKPCEPYPCLTLKAFQDGKIHEHDTQVVDKDGNTRYFHCSANVALRDEQGKPTAVLEISKDTTEQMLNQQALKESEEKFRSLAEQSPNMIFINKDGRIVYANKKCEEVTGYKREEFYSPDFDFLTLIAPQSRDLIKEYYKEHSKGGDVPTYEYTILNKAGERIDAINSCKLIHYEGGNAIIGVITDITHRKLAEEALRESESSYRAVVENSAEGIVVVQDQMLRFVNPAIVSMTGYSERELLTQPFIEFIHPDHRDWAVGIHIKRLNGEEVPLTYELKILDKKGNIKWLENNGILFEWRDKPATLNFLRDITDRKKAEQAIWASESEKKSILNAISDHILFHDTDLLIRWGNEAAARSIGMTQRELVGRYCYELWHGRSEPCERCPVLRALETGSYSEGIMTTPDGKLWEIVGEPVRDRDGEIRGAIEISRDITERKKAEAALAESEQRFRKFFENEPEYCYMVSPEGIILEANNAVFSALGYAKEELVGKPIENIYAPESQQKARQLFAQWKKTGEIRNEEMVIITRSGDRRNVLLSSTQVLSEHGTVLYSVSIQRDISERKRLVEAYRSLVDNSLQGLAIIQDGRMVFFNKAFSSTAGYSEQELLAASPEQLQSMVHPEDRELVWTRHRDRLAGKPLPPRYEFRWIRKDGSTAWVEIFASEIEYRGRPAIQTAYIDITERKKAEQALRQSEERLKILFESAPDAIYLSDLEGNLVDGNKAAEKILGYAKAELIGKSFIETGILSSEQMLRAVANLKKNSMGKPTGPDEFILTRKDGSSVSVEIRSFPVRILDRDLSLSIAHDISARKKAEQRLLENRAQLKSLASELSLTEERERRRLATNLHDQISQALVISRIKLQALRTSISSADIAGSLEEVCENLDRIIQDTRTLTFDLSSPILYELGFEAAVSEWLEEQVGKKHGIKTQFEDDGRPKPLEDDIRVLLFRNVRELLINIVKHARARNVKVSICRIRQQVCVSIEDDGIGFDQAEVASGTGFGIFSIRERLEQLAGHIEIKSELGRGSKIMMTAPLKCEKVSRDKKRKPRKK